jgi:hypothetical protein
MAIQSNERNFILRTTLILGIGLGIFQGIIWLIAMPLTSGITSTPSIIAFLFLVSPIIWVIGFFFLGIWVGKRTGDLGQATKNGLFSGIFASLIAAMAHVLVITLSLTSANGSQPLNIAWEAIGVGIETMALATAAGTAFGWVGGYIGQYISTVTPPNKLPTTGPTPTYSPPPVFYSPPPAIYVPPIQPSATPPVQPQQPPSATPPSVPGEHDQE